MKSKATKLTGYRVDMQLIPSGKWVEYTSLKRPVTLEMGLALGRSLKRQNSPGRVVNVATGEIVEEWGRDAH